MPTTPTLALPYPASTDPADVPADIHALDNRIEALFGAANGFASLDATGKLTSAQAPASGLVLATVTMTADATVPVATEASPQTIMTLPSFVSDGVTPIEIEVYIAAGIFTSAAQGFNLWDDTPTDQGRMFWTSSNPGVIPIYVARQIVPSAGTRVYRVRAYNATGSTVYHAGTGGAGAWPPAFMRARLLR